MKPLIVGLIGFTFALGTACAALRADVKPKAPNVKPKPRTTPTPPGYEVAKFELPPPALYGTAYSRGYVRHTTALPFKPRGPVFLPKGAANVALHKPVSSSDEKPRIGTLAMITDGDKSSTKEYWDEWGGRRVRRVSDTCFIQLGPGTQWVQIDLQKQFTIHGILLWHFYALGNVHRDVVIQLADDMDFTTNLRTIFNTDNDNSSGLGIGKDREFYESHQGQWIPVRAQTARFVRLYSRGNSRDPMNFYTEVEVRATDVKPKSQPQPRATQKHQKKR